MVQGPSGRKLQQEAYPGVGAVARTVSAILFTLSRSSVLPLLHWTLE